MPFEDPRCSSCRRCCLATEMILLPSDIRRIERATGIPRKEFAVFDGVFYRIRNVNGRCFFLKSWGCSIYWAKPLGCSIYPLVFDEIEGPIIDESCPLAHEFARRCSDVRQALDLLRVFLAELEEAYGYRVRWELFDVGARRLLELCSDRSSITSGTASQRGARRGPLRHPHSAGE